METVGMENLSSAAAQGEQAFDPHHANGYNFTGADPNVRTLEDAVRQRLSTVTAVTGAYSCTLDLYSCKSYYNKLEAVNERGTMVCPKTVSAARKRKGEPNPCARTPRRSRVPL